MSRKKLQKAALDSAYKLFVTKRKCEDALRKIQVKPRDYPGRGELKSTLEEWRVKGEIPLLHGRVASCSNRRPDAIIVTAPPMFNSFSKRDCGAYWRTLALAKMIPTALIVGVDFPSESQDPGVRKVFAQLQKQGRSIKAFAEAINQIAKLYAAKYPGVPFYYVGHSYAGLLGAYLLQHHVGENSIFKKFILIDPVGWYLQPTWWDRFMHLRLIRSFIGENTEMQIHQALPVIDEGMYKYMMNQTLTQILKGVVTLAKLTVREWHSLPEMYGGAIFPLLQSAVQQGMRPDKLYLLTGGASSLAPQEEVKKVVNRLTLQLPHGKDKPLVLEEVAGMGHSLLENPQVFADEVQKILGI